MSKSLEQLNNSPHERALNILRPFVERSDWVAQKVIKHRPFASAHDVAQNLINIILESDFETRVALFRAHPQLAGKEAELGSMTEASTSEQGRLGLMSLSGADKERLTKLNVAYTARFGHPFIIALHRVSDLADLFDTFERRLECSPVEEHVSTLAEIASVIHARVVKAVGPSEHVETELATTNEADHV